MMIEEVMIMRKWLFYLALPLFGCDGNDVGLPSLGANSNVAEVDP